MRCACRWKITRRAFPRGPETRKGASRGKRPSNFMVSPGAVRGSEEPHGDRTYEKKRKPGRHIPNLHCEHFSLHLAGGGRFSGFAAAHRKRNRMEAKAPFSGVSRMAAKSLNPPCNPCVNEAASFSPGRHILRCGVALPAIPAHFAGCGCGSAAEADDRLAHAFAVKQALQHGGGFGERETGGGFGVDFSGRGPFRQLLHQRNV